MNRNRALKSTGQQQAIMASLGLDSGDLRHRVSRRHPAATTTSRSSTSVAQTLGLLPKAKVVNWDEVESSAIEKGLFDSTCAICLTRHGQQQRHSVITSCGHVFHQSCLKATRQNQSSSKCPLCRSPYTSRIAKKGHKRARRAAASQIQASIRGWLVRRKMARRHPKVFKRQARQVKLADFGRHLAGDAARLQSQSDALIDQSEVALRQARLIFAKVKLSESTIDECYRAAKKRAQSDAQCPVCLVQLGTKPVSLLSCGHVLHVKCREQLETFVDQIACPLCRQPYTYVNDKCV